MRWPGKRAKPPFGLVTINQSHQLARELVGCWVFNERAGRAYDMARKSPETTVGVARWAPTSKGVTRDFDGTADAIQVPGTQYNLTGRMTVVTQLRVDTSGQQRIVSHWGDTSGEQQWLLEKTGSENPQFARQVSSNFRIATGTTALATGTWYQIAGRYDGATTEVLLNAKSEASVGPALTAVSTTHNVRIGHEGDGSSSLWLNGQVDYVYIYARSLPGPDLCQLLDEPYAFLEPIIRRRWFIPTTGINGTLQATLDALALTADGDIRVAGALAKSLDDLTPSASGAVRVAASLAQTLGVAVVAGEGDVLVAASLARLLADLQISASGTVASGGPLPIGTVPVRYVLGQTANVVPVETVASPGIGVVSVREFVGPANVVPVRETASETPRVKVRKV